MDPLTPDELKLILDAIENVRRYSCICRPTKKLLQALEPLRRDTNG